MKIIIIFLALLGGVANASEIERLDYEGFTVQAANMNRGVWLLTEEITECYRDIDELLIVGGVIWGDNSGDDYFVK